MTWEEVAERLKSLEKTRTGWGVAVRFTDNPERDKELRVSFQDWGLAPADNVEECEAEYGEGVCVYDETAGGWLPALDGLCAFHDYDADGAVLAARQWSFSNAYKYIIVGPARLVDTVHDGDVVEFDFEEVVVLPNPDFE